jgi:hypothetical protein
MTISEVHLGPASALKEGASARPDVALHNNYAVVKVGERRVRCAVDSLVSVGSDGPGRSVTLDLVVITDGLKGSLGTISGLSFFKCLFGILILTGFRGHNGESVALENTSLVVNPVVEGTHFLGSGDGNWAFLRSVFFDHVLIILIQAVNTLGNKGVALNNASNLSAEVEFFTLLEEGVSDNFAFEVA